MRTYGAVRTGGAVPPAWCTRSSCRVRAANHVDSAAILVAEVENPALSDRIQGLRAVAA